MKRVTDLRANVHRDLFYDRFDQQKGRDVRGVQTHHDTFVEAHPHLGVTPLKVDGLAQRQTIAQARLSATLLGYVHLQSGLSEAAQIVLRDPDSRTKTQVERGKLAQAARRKDLAALPAKAHVSGNRVTGGTPRQRLAAGGLQAVHNCTAHPASRFYDQDGGWDVGHAIVGEARDKRSDCSQFVISLAKCCDVADPSGTGFSFGNTDTLAGHCHEIERASLRVGDLVIYYTADGRTHHVEMWFGDGVHTYAQLAKMGSALRDRTIGHGSPPVDFGDIDMISRPRFFRHPARV